MVGSLKRLGPYDYIEFYKSLKNQEFRENVYTGYVNGENIKKRKNIIIQDVYNHFFTISTDHFHKCIDLNLNPLYNHLCKNNITLPTKEPCLEDEEYRYNSRTPTNEIKDRNDKFYETYTLWHMVNIV